VNQSQHREKTKTKIVCTLGPSTNSLAKVIALIKSGMSVARLNLAHGTIQDHKKSIDLVRSASKQLDQPVGIMVDVPGKKYRTGDTNPKVVKIDLKDTISLTSKDVSGTSQLIPIKPAGIHIDANPGQTVAIADGLVKLKVIEVSGEKVICEAITPGEITKGRGVRVAGMTAIGQFLNEATFKSIDFAAEHKADFVAISSVGSASNVESIREELSQRGVNPSIISKIETAEGIRQFKSILAASEGIMVARGDMGVEVDLAEVPIIQKQLIKASNIAGKPVITATQMLESMISSPSPTRAEVTDVANAVFDGSDAIMLSGETSIGKYPIESVSMMSKVAIEAEKSLPYESILVEKRDHMGHQTDDSIAYNSCQTAHQVNADLIVAFTESGSTAARVSKYRPRSNILALTPFKETERKLTLTWGVVPVTTEPAKDVDDFFRIVREEANKAPEIKGEGLVVLVAGLPIGVPGGTNMLRVMSV